MCKINESQAAASQNGINYYVICDRSASDGRRFGILSVLSDDETDRKTADNLFFTQEEAENYCRWLAENEVYPISLCEVLGNIYHI